MGKISLIVAMATNRAIGRANDMLWRLPNDFRHFRELTTGHPIIMGRKTFESLPKGALPDRTNIVVTHQASYSAPDCRVVTSLDEAIALATNLGSDEIFVIGGGEIYRQALPQASRVYLTAVNTAPENADTFFPELPETEWKLASSESHSADEKHAYDYDFRVYERIDQSAKVVDPHYAKSGEYRVVLEEIQSGKKCPFCPGQLHWHKEPILKEENGWLITRNSWPYQNAAHHFLLIGREHHDRFDELSSADWETIRGLINWAITEFKLPGGGIAMRFGETTYTGATVVHFHIHMIVPEIDPETGRAKPVNFPIG